MKPCVGVHSASTRGTLIRHHPILGPYRGTSLIRDRRPLGPYSRIYAGPYETLCWGPQCLYLHPGPYRGTHIRHHPILGPYRDTSLIRDRRPLGPYSRTIRRAL